MPQVIIKQPDIETRTVALSVEETRFGRSEESDIVLVADEVSRLHAKICRRGNNMVLMDLKSLNGTYVNRQRIVERVLSHEDEIWFGSKCCLTYHEEPQFKEQAAGDSQVMRNMDVIREEMDRVGNNMTMMGRATPAPEGTIVSAQPDATAADLLQMGRAYRRLSALHKASQVMASAFDLDQRLSQVLDIVLEEMGAERGFVMLRNPLTNDLEVKVARAIDGELREGSPSMGIAGKAALDGEPVLMEDSGTDKEFGMRESIIRSRITCAMCAPLTTKDQVLGSIYIDTRKGGVTFTKEDLELFVSLGTQSAMAIDNVQLHDQVVEAEKKRQNFGRFLSPAIVDKIMNEEGDLVLGGQKTVVSTLFCDIRGFTGITERIEPEALVDLLNEYFSEMTDIVFKHQGTLDKYVGDEIMAVFGAPVSSGDDAYQAVCAAIEMQKRNTELNELRKQESRPHIDLGIGICTGEVTAGYFGSPMRMEFTVMGDRVNTGSRFCDAASAGKIVIGDETFEKVRERIDANPMGAIKLKNKEFPVSTHEVTGLKAGQA
jgi:adenylate cyclase